MKTYINAELQIVRVKNNDIVTTSNNAIEITSTSAESGIYYDAPDRMRD